MANLLISNNPKIDFDLLERRIHTSLIAAPTQLISTFSSPRMSYCNMTISDLLNLKEQQFIEACFCTILGREVDKESAAHYLKKLKKGYDPRAIIAFLRYSKEGRSYFKNHNQHLPSLLKYRLLCFPVIRQLVSKILPYL